MAKPSQRALHAARAQIIEDISRDHDLAGKQLLNHLIAKRNDASIVFDDELGQRYMFLFKMLRYLAVLP